jgi:hypothetical protein
VVVDPGVDIGFGSVVMVTPFANTKKSAYWVTRDLEGDTFTIRMSPTLKQATPFSWLIVESGLEPPTKAEPAEEDATDEESADEESADEEPAE